MGPSKASPSQASNDQLFKSSSSRSGSPSLINIILLYVTLLGLGAIGGYATFYAVFAGRCSQRLEEAGHHHNKTLSEMEKRYMNAVDAHTKCTQDDSREREVDELRGRLDSHEALVGEHRGLLKKYQQNVERLAATKSQQDESDKLVKIMEQQLKEKQTEVSKIQDEAELHRQEKIGLERKLADQRDLSAAIVKKKVEENKRLASTRDQCASDSRILELEMQAMKDQIRTRQKALVQERHGNGPFYVQFVLKFHGYSEPDSFTVELPSLRELPHSVYIFLELVESRLYEGTSFMWNTDKVLRVSGSENKDGLALAQRYRDLGFGDSALVFTEMSNIHRCRRHSIGFVTRGPALEIFLSDDAVSDSNRSCFGRIVRGVKTISRIEVAMAKGEMVDVMAVELSNFDGSDHSEL